MCWLDHLYKAKRAASANSIANCVATIFNMRQDGIEGCYRVEEEREENICITMCQFTLFLYFFCPSYQGSCENEYVYISRIYLHVFAIQLKYLNFIFDIEKEDFGIHFKFYFKNHRVVSCININMYH